MPHVFAGLPEAIDGKNISKGLCGGATFKWHSHIDRGRKLSRCRIRIGNRIWSKVQRWRHPPYVVTLEPKQVQSPQALARVVFAREVPLSTVMLPRTQVCHQSQKQGSDDLRAWSPGQRLLRAFTPPTFVNVQRRIAMHVQAVLLDAAMPLR